MSVAHLAGPVVTKWAVDDKGHLMIHLDPIAYSKWCPQCEEKFEATTVAELDALVTERHYPGMGEFSRDFASTDE
jgi:hypothetical protein